MRLELQFERLDCEWRVCGAVEVGQARQIDCLHDVACSGVRVTLPVGGWSGVWFTLHEQAHADGVAVGEIVDVTHGHAATALNLH